jgi:Survival motor neuron (SMN) interacting protein 1 (SIP1)
VLSRLAVLIHCYNPSQNVNQPTIYVHLTPEKECRKLMPEKKERDLWWAFLAGKPESDWNPPKEPKWGSKYSKPRRGMRGFADDTVSYEHPMQEPFQNDDEEVETVLRVDPLESLPTPTCSPEPPETSTLREDQLIEPSSMVPDGTPTKLKPREPMPSLLKHIDQVRSIHHSS